jgi:hypothetical protein
VVLNDARDTRPSIASRTSTVLSPSHLLRLAVLVLDVRRLRVESFDRCVRDERYAPYLEQE